MSRVDATKKGDVRIADTNNYRTDKFLNVVVDVTIADARFVIGGRQRFAFDLRPSTSPFTYL